DEAAKNSRNDAGRYDVAAAAAKNPLVAQTGSCQVRNSVNTRFRRYCRLRPYRHALVAVRVAVTVNHLLKLAIDAVCSLFVRVEVAEAGKCVVVIENTHSVLTGQTCVSGSMVEEVVHLSDR